MVDQGAELIGGYTDDTSRQSLAPLPAIVFGDHTRIAKYIEIPFVQGADGVRVLCATAAVDPKFAYHALRCVRLPDKGYSRHFKFLKATAFPLAPVAEQRRIVAKVDHLSGRSARARGQLDRIPRLVKKYRQAILAAAFRGDLTRQWRIDAGLDDRCAEHDELPKELAERPIPIGWKVKSIADVANNYDGKRVPVRESDRALRRGKFPYYGASGVIDTIDDYLFDGDYLLIGEDGANLIYRSTPIAFHASGQFWVNNHAHVLKARERTSNEWLCQFINMIDLAPYVTGTAQPKLTQAALNKIYIPMPPTDEQQAILRLIVAACSWVDRLETEATKAGKLIGNLENAILAKAFQGELVPQDPSDEPASVLLERIKAERIANETAAKEKKPGRNIRPKTRLVRLQKSHGKRKARKEDGGEVTQRKNLSDPSTDGQPGDGGFTNPVMYNSIEEAIAAGTVEDRWLESLDQPDEDNQAD
ncbi:restriction endonuclease subunit S [Bradyrhizobium sp. UFLA05-153]